MFMKNKFALLIGLISVCPLILAQKTMPFTYNFGFSINKNEKVIPEWSVSQEPLVNVSTDTSLVFRGKHPLKIEQVDYMSLYSPLKCTLQQTILFPGTGNDSLSVSFTCKSSHLEALDLILMGTDGKDNIICQDTVPVSVLDGWHTSKKSIGVKDVVMLHLSIRVKGENRQRHYYLDKKEQFLWIDRLELTMGGKDLSAYPVANYADSIHLSQEDIVPLPWNDPAAGSGIASLRNRKIVALGEAIHGSQSINKLAIELMKYRIEYERCKLVLLELPLQKMLYVNRFAQGDEAFEPDNIKELFDYALFSDEMFDFFAWVKKYNAENDEKVWVLGTDFEYASRNRNLDLCEYFLPLNRTGSCLEMDTLCDLLARGGNSVPDYSAMKYLYANRFFESHTGPTESRIIEHCLHIGQQANTLLDNAFFEMRDSIMFDNLRFLYTLLCRDRQATVTVYTHLDHAKYISPDDPKPSFGTLAKKAFGEDYCCIGIFAGKGEVLNNKGHSLAVSSLSEPVKNSFEDLLGRIPGDCFYLPAESLPRYPLFMRRMGYYDTNNNYLFAIPPSLMESAIFIHRSEALTKRPCILGKDLYPNETFINRFMRLTKLLKITDKGHDKMKGKYY
jgi:erythromycin esterase-like protein